ncbi:hypothetical protein R1flu_017316 [Riccia fluitans]|uniref:Uncharacterized protein n=1 Tax=Riccia fluitans TaxID=41844 RepID=A0ABD1ZCY9_9MARC
MAWTGVRYVPTRGTAQPTCKSGQTGNIKGTTISAIENKTIRGHETRVRIPTSKARRLDVTSIPYFAPRRTAKVRARQELLTRGLGARCEFLEREREFDCYGFRSLGHASGVPVISLVCIPSSGFPVILIMPLYHAALRPLGPFFGGPSSCSSVLAWV